ncbi:hypothetical protein L1987_55110 [Smallanthus sonchifolius]|uniref:Uncharacterized protein n=1 Tax=Smallanthus sonchifolius TaxID=185202 RepID=A0ACB9E8S8_9ASTR|nr:hypothetical protein L1987_55110 [Smallanthus sonchifolius]
MDAQSLNILSKIADNCLNQQYVHRPSMDQIVKELENVLELHKKPEKLEQSTSTVEAIYSNILTREKMEHLKIPLSDIKLATNSFKSCIGSGGYGKGIH